MLKKTNLKKKNVIENARKIFYLQVVILPFKKQKKKHIFSPMTGKILRRLLDKNKQGSQPRLIILIDRFHLCIYNGQSIVANGQFSLWTYYLAIGQFSLGPSSLLCRLLDPQYLFPSRVSHADHSSAMMIMIGCKTLFVHDALNVGFLIPLRRHEILAVIRVYSIYENISIETLASRFAVQTQYIVIRFWWVQT